MEKYNTKSIGHLGLVAQMIDELGIVSLIDNEIPQDLAQRNASIGQVIKALVICGLGFTNHRLYLASHFFENKPVEQLIGPGIKAEHLNDDVLGRALDEVYQYGVTAMFHKVSAQAAQVLGIESHQFHADSTTFHVDGKYNSDESEGGDVIHITKGYSRDKRPDLNQFALNLIVENQAGIPLSIQMGDGNQSDNHELPNLIKQYIKQLQPNPSKPLFVADAAWYTEKGISESEEAGYLFVSRVPATLKLMKSLLEEIKLEELHELKEGYKGLTVERVYGGTTQRWLVIHSDEAKQRAEKTVGRRLEKQTDKEVKLWQKLCRQSFNCEQDAKEAIAHFQKNAKWCQLDSWTITPQLHYDKKGRPSKDALPDKQTYIVAGGIYSPMTVYQEAVDRKALFVLATNQLDTTEMTEIGILETYQGQVSVERGFRFMKDPLFLINSIFLKKEERIMATMMVMTICLLVYAALEYRIRQTLATAGETIPDQKGKPTSKPTTRWVFQSFIDISILTIAQPDAPPQTLCLNLKPELKRLLELLGPTYTQIYFLTPSKG